jgi:hypothetical protein
VPTAGFSVAARQAGVGGESTGKGRSGQEEKYLGMTMDGAFDFVVFLMTRPGEAPTAEAILLIVLCHPTAMG